MNAVFHPWPIREFRDRSDGIPESGVQGRFSSAHEFKHGGLSYRAETMDGNNGRVRGTPRRRRPAWPSQFGDFEVSVPASGSDRGWPRGQTETVENLASDGGIFDSGQNTHPAAAAWTFQHIHGENSRHQLGPAVIARMWLFFFRGVSMSAGFHENIASQEAARRFSYSPAAFR